MRNQFFATLSHGYYQHKKDLAEHPDDFLYERAARFSVSVSGMGAAVKRLGFSRKKKPKAS
jgi:hypothetical protein